MANRWYYVCDRCGNLVTIRETPIPEGEDWACDKCGSSAMWEFTNQRAAVEHAHHVKRGYDSKLFRGAR